MNLALYPTRVRSSEVLGRIRHPRSKVRRVEQLARRDNGRQWCVIRRARSDVDTRQVACGVGKYQERELRDFRRFVHHLEERTALPSWRDKGFDVCTRGNLKFKGMTAWKQLM